MIAVSNTESLAGGLSISTPIINIPLSTTLLDQYLVDGVIINNTITVAVKSILKSILISTSSLSISDSISRLAIYAGFSSSNGVVSFNGNNASLDKLTFYIIFRLPYSEVTKIKSLIFEDPLPESSNIPSNSDKKWGKYANYIRTLSDSGIKKINSAGEQVNLLNKPVNDSNQVIEGWFSEEAYNFLAEFPFNNNGTVPVGLFSTQTEKAMLFGQNTNQPNSAGEIPLQITKIPLFFYLLAKVENPYNSTFWLNPSKDSLTISRVPHWPASIRVKSFRKHFIKITNNSSNIIVTDNQYNLQNDSTGTFFLYNLPNSTSKQKFYISPLDSNALNFENLSLLNATKLEKNKDGFLAIWEKNLENPLLSNNSGLTVGMGVDIGAGFEGIYKIKFDITINGGSNSSFRLYYGSRRTEPIFPNVSVSDFRKIVSNLIESDLSKVKISKNQTSGVFTIEIDRSNSVNDKAYNHKIYSSDLILGADVIFSPENESERWIEKQESINDSFYFFSQLLNFSFSNNPNNDEYWISQIANLDESEKTNLKKVLKKEFGCRSKSGYPLWDEYKILIKKIEIKSYVQNLRATYHKFFVERYYNKQKIIKGGVSKNNAYNSTVQHLLENSKLKSKPNQAELFAIVLLNYNYPSLFKKRIDLLINAINLHSIPLLKSTLNGLSGDRKNALSNFIGSSTILKLYHGITD